MRPSCRPGGDIFTSLLSFLFTGHWRIHFGGQGCEDQKEREHLQPQYEAMRRTLILPSRMCPEGKKFPPSRVRRMVLSFQKCVDSWFTWRKVGDGVEVSGLHCCTDLWLVPLKCRTGLPVLGHHLCHFLLTKRKSGWSCQPGEWRCGSKTRSLLGSIDLRLSVILAPGPSPQHWMDFLCHLWIKHLLCNFLKVTNHWKRRGRNGWSMWEKSNFVLF